MVNENNTIKRDYSLDILKGIMIISVILGHIAFILTTDGDLDNNILFISCYSWHMYCFMMVSGYIAGRYSKIENNWQKLGLRVYRLLFPYVIWTILRAIFIGNVSIPAVLTDLMVSPLYWYLFVQFIYEFVVCISGNNRSLPVILGFAVVYVVLYCLFKTEMLRQIVMHYPYYFIGYALSKVEENKLKNFKNILYFSLPLYPVSMLLYSFSDRSRIDNVMQLILHKCAFPDKLNDIILWLARHGGYQLYNYAIVAVLGSSFFLCISMWIDKHDDFAWGG